MARRPRSQQQGAWTGIVLPVIAAAALTLLILAATALPAGAATCTAPLPAAGTPGPTGTMATDTMATDAMASTGTSKFRLIAQQCPGLDAPAVVHRTEQLALFDRATTIAINLVGVPEPVTLAMGALPSERAPLGAAGERVVALAPALSAAARANELDPLLLHAIAHVESRHNAQAVSPAGARGVMQMMPATAQRFGVANPEKSLHDAGTNLRASAALLRTLQARYGGDLRLVLAAYNAGEGAVAKHGNRVPPYPETQAYVRDVLAIHQRLSTEFAVSGSGQLVAKGL
ncbi:lytic transglycosylase domain-containing protein [Aquabacterium sp.]|uniref:lytic transglycosylase domain-containing protein n=1 Tax=Aquabacterium sp. TaxID=1872578 RepID=UPI002C78390B|nr:lytic transglycosylase domain-containing protein [Aquabacterium sp.]HSW05259.1 lytic transglycosylase domain-containing protein [Aquabacterium sp.]